MTDPDRQRKEGHVDDDARQPPSPAQARSQMAGVFLFGLLLLYVWGSYQHYLAITPTPSWDGFAYMENARNWREGTPVSQPYRSPLISWVIAGVWLFTGEDWRAVQALNALFTLAAAILLYIVIRRHKGDWFALGVCGLTLLNPTSFIYSTQLYTEGLAALCLAGALYCLESKKAVYWLLGGICLGLAFGARYPVIVAGALILGAEFLTRQDWRLLRASLVGLVPTMGAIILLMVVKTGTFMMSLPKDRQLTLQLSSYYVTHALELWGLVVVLVPLALLLPSTWRRPEHLPYLAWMVGALIFWSANSLNVQPRFIVNFTPAVYYVALLFVEWTALRALRARHVSRHALPS